MSWEFPDPERDEDRFPVSSVTVIVPTLGRPTLARLFASLERQLLAGDEVIVVADAQGFVDAAAEMYEHAGRDSCAFWRFHVMDSGCWGHPARNWAMSEARGDLLWSLNDDDTAAPLALAHIRGADRHAPSIFRSVWEPGTRFANQPYGYAAPLLWNDPSVRLGNVDAAMIVAPSSCEARWGLRYEGDYDFAVALEREYGRVAWRTNVVAEKG